MRLIMFQRAHWPGAQVCMHHQNQAGDSIFATRSPELLSDPLHWESGNVVCLPWDHCCGFVIGARCSVGDRDDSPLGIRTFGLFRRSRFLSCRPLFSRWAVQPSIHEVIIEISASASGLWVRGPCCRVMQGSFVRSFRWYHIQTRAFFMFFFVSAVRYKMPKRWARKLLKSTDGARRCAV